MFENSIHGLWFAIQVRPRHELAVARALRDKGYEEFVPLSRQARTWSDRKQIIESPLFSCYVFCRFVAEVRAPIVTTPGVVRVVGSRQGPIPVDPDEIASIRRVAQAGLATQPHPYLPAGIKVVMSNGPLAGVEGIVTGSRNQHLILSINLLQRSISVSLDGSLGDSILPQNAANYRSCDLSA